jgi:hypothetical protein
VWVSRVSPKANEMVRGTISSGERPERKRRAGDPAFARKKMGPLPSTGPDRAGLARRVLALVPCSHRQRRYAINLDRIERYRHRSKTSHGP